MQNIAIIGGGIAGLTAALAFARRGFTVDLFEQAPAFREVGAGIQISPNAGRVLVALGLGGCLVRLGLPARAVVSHDALTGRRIATFALDRQDPPYVFFHRADLIDLLFGACQEAGVRLHLDAAVRPSGAGGLRVGDDVVRADLIVGADGLHSVLRPLVEPQAPAAAFTGQVAWRAVIAAEAEPAATIWMAPGRHVVTYPLRDGRLNIVAVQERRDWAAEGWTHPDDPANLRAAFSECCAELRNLLRQVTEPGLWGLFRHPVARHWFAGNMVLVGDAAHPTLPFLAQGANLAIEDAYVLARHCAEAPDAATALARYRADRAPRVSRAIAAAEANARNYHLDGVARRAAHAALRTVATVSPGAFLGRLSWLYDHDVTA